MVGRRPGSNRKLALNYLQYTSNSVQPIISFNQLIVAKYFWKYLENLYLFFLQKQYTWFKVLNPFFKKTPCLWWLEPKPCKCRPKRVPAGGASALPVICSVCERHRTAQFLLVCICTLWGVLPDPTLKRGPSSYFWRNHVFDPLKIWNLRYFLKKLFPALWRTSFLRKYGNPNPSWISQGSWKDGLCCRNYHL